MSVTKLAVEIEREDDGRRIAAVPELPGLMAYGETSEQAVTRVEAPALRILTDRFEHGETVPSPCRA